VATATVATGLGQHRQNIMPKTQRPIAGNDRRHQGE